MNTGKTWEGKIESVKNPVKTTCETLLSFTFKQHFEHSFSIFFKQ